ncbi:MAG TPA: hypothetical protein VGN73_11430 [Gemmatimonadaceae bacterium]|jgi:hypothetical protein|nr:hypothetical protein [Gemmatimonadaceae bacterium]
MTAPTASPTRPDLLPRDNIRSVLAALIALLTVGGWIDALGKTPLRDALHAQTRLWWIEQIVGIALALVCIAIIMRKRAFLEAAFWLTIYSTLFDVMRWIFEFIDGQLRIPIALVLYLLFLWRLVRTRRQVDPGWNAPIVESPPA